MARNGRMGEDGMVAATRTSNAWERYAWVAGILYVIALVAETVVGLLGGGLSQNASAAKIANTLYDHRGRLLVIACLSVVYAAMFLIYLAKLYDLLRRDTDRSRFLGSLVLAGGTLFIALHAQRPEPRELRKRRAVSRNSAAGPGGPDGLRYDES
jgi:hypothetical protein